MTKSKNPNRKTTKRPIAVKFFLHYQCDLVSPKGNVLNSEPCMHHMVIRVRTKLLEDTNPLILLIEEHDKVFPGHVITGVDIINSEPVKNSELKRTPLKEGQSHEYFPPAKKNASGGLAGLIEP